jgi:hypothetical protein
MCLLLPGLRCMRRLRLTCFAASPAGCWWRLSRAKAAQPIVVQKRTIAPNPWRTSNKCRTCWSNCMCRIHYEDDVGGAVVLIRSLVQGPANRSSRTRWLGRRSCWVNHGHRLRHENDASSQVSNPYPWRGRRPEDRTAWTCEDCAQPPAYCTCQTQTVCR